MAQEEIGLALPAGGKLLVVVGTDGQGTIRRAMPFDVAADDGPRRYSQLAKKVEGQDRVMVLKVECVFSGRQHGVG